MPDAALSAWLAAEATARQVLADRFGVSPSAIELQKVVMQLLGLEDHRGLLDRIWTDTMLLETVKAVDFRALSDFEVVHLESSILPDDCPGRLDEETLKAIGEIWRIHMNDIDDFPSRPHAHNLETGFKLDLSNGKVYDKRRFVEQIKRKKLLILRNAVKRTRLQPLAV